jgi:hypothetical protein
LAIVVVSFLAVEDHSTGWWYACFSSIEGGRHNVMAGPRIHMAVRPGDDSAQASWCVRLPALARPRLTR